MNEELGKIALAGLLHDIGKFGQRAGEKADGRSDHAAVGDKFVRQYVPEVWRDALAPVGWHHGDPEGKAHELFPVVVVRAADRLSAGERERLEDEEKGVFAPQMASPFSHLARLGHLSDSSPRWLPLTPLTLDETKIFAVKNPWPEDELKRSYRKLWYAFCREMEALRDVHKQEPRLETYLLCLQDILLRYTWCIPSAFYYDVPDVSLYDHLRTTAALAVCLYKAFREREGELRELLEALKDWDPQRWPEARHVAILVEGDISGIQNFIYALRNPRGAAAVLRARSFYLQILTEALARWILRRLDLPPVNLLYCGGGRFRLLIPVDEEAKLEGLRAEANEALFRAHQGALYLALAGVPLAPAHFGPAPVQREGCRWKTPPDRARGLRHAEEILGNTLTSQKNRRFLELSWESLQELFRPFGSGEICQVCGHPASDIEEDEEGVRWCGSCRGFRELGQELRNAQFLRITELPPTPLPARPDWSEVLAHLGFTIQVGKEPLPPASEPSILYRLTDEPLPVRTSKEAVVRKFLVNVVPIWKEGEKPPVPEKEYEGKPGETKHFGVLARQAKGAPYLGVLRMDMDNLGRLFRDGFIRKKEPENFVDQGTFSRKQSLSTLLSVFFEGWVGERVRLFHEKEGIERVYAVYSGGDDLFFVGSWDAVVELVEFIRTDFQRFSGREDLGISAGLLLVHEKYPLFSAAQETGARLETAKQAEGDESPAESPCFLPRKDRIWFLGQAVPWTRFLTKVKPWKEQLVRAVKEDEAARRVLFVLREMEEEYRRGREKRGEWGPWIWRTAYWLARQKEMAQRAERDTALYDQLLAELSGERFAENIRLLALAARWAELETRKTKGGEE